MAINPDPLSVLRETEESQNPVMVRYWHEFGSVSNSSYSAENYIEKCADVERILEKGRDQEEKIKSAFAVLSNANALPADIIPEGM
jgi:hypothetical protein